MLNYVGDKGREDGVKEQIQEIHYFTLRFTEQMFDICGNWESNGVHSFAEFTINYNPQR